MIYNVGEVNFLHPIVGNVSDVFFIIGKHKHLQLTVQCIHYYVDEHLTKIEFRTNLDKNYHAYNIFYTDLYI